MHRTNTTPLTPQRLQSRYNYARYSLFLLVAFSVINIVLLLTKDFSYYLFSAYIPYTFVVVGMDYCGLLPPELYGLTPEEMAMIEFFPIPVFVILLVIALFILTMYAVMALMAGKQRYGWLIAALVMVSIDTTSVLQNLTIDPIDTLVDLAFHVLLIVELSLGIHAAIKLKTTPPEALAAEGMDTNPDIPFDITLPVDPVTPTDAPTTDTPAEATADADAPTTDTPAEEGVCGIPDAPTIPDAPEIQ